MRPIIAFTLAIGLAALAAAQDSVSIYVTYGQMATEVAAFVAAEDIRGAVLAAERLNEQGGVLGRRVDIIDGRATSLDDVRIKAQEQLDADEIIAVVGANTSNMTLVVAPLFHAAGIPVVSPIATHPAVTAVGDHVFRACFTDPFQGELMATFALDDLDARRAVILTKVDSTYSLSLSEHFERSFSARGEVVWTGRYLADDSDFTALLEAVRRIAPDVVFVPGHGGDAGLLLKTARALGIRAVFLGGDGWGKGVLGIAGAEAVEGGYYANHWHADVQAAQSREFVRRYTARYGETLIAASAALAYDAVHMIADAITRAGSFERRAVRNALALTAGFEGVTGTITFNEQGDPVGKSGVVLVYRDGDIRFVRSVAP